MTTSGTIREKIVSILQALAIFSDADVTDSDWRVLDRGNSPYAVVYSEGTPEILERDDQGAAVYLRYRSLIDVIATWTPDQQTAITDAMDAVFTQLNTYPQLEDLQGVMSAELAVESSPIRYLYHNESDDYPQFAIVTFTHYAHVQTSYYGEGEFIDG